MDTSTPGIGPSPQELALDISRRAIAADLSRDDVRPDEVTALAARTESRSAMIYLSWRRCALWFAGVTLGVSVLLGLPDLFETLGQTDDQMAKEMFGAPEATPPISDFNAIIQLLSFLLVLGPGVAAFALIQAARNWVDVGSSIRVGRLALLAAVGLPLALSLIPWTQLIDWQWMQDNGQSAEQVKSATATVGLLFAIVLFLKVGPAVIGLCSGIIRASMTLKTFLPESFLPGWTVVAFTPVYAILMITVVILLNQTNGDLILLTGIGFLIAGPANYLVRPDAILSACSRSDETAMNRIRELRKRAASFYLVGTVAVGFWVYDRMDLGFLDGLTFVLSAMGTAMTMSVVAADFQLGLIGKSWHQLRSIRDSGLEAELEQRLGDLDSAKLL